MSQVIYHIGIHSGFPSSPQYLIRKYLIQIMSSKNWEFQSSKHFGLRKSKSPQYWSIWSVFNSFISGSLLILIFMLKGSEMVTKTRLQWCLWGCCLFCFLFCFVFNEMNWGEIINPECGWHYSTERWAESKKRELAKHHLDLCVLLHYDAMWPTVSGSCQHNCLYDGLYLPTTSHINHSFL